MSASRVCAPEQGHAVSRWGHVPCSKKVMARFEGILARTQYPRKARGPIRSCPGLTFGQFAEHPLHDGARVHTVSGPIHWLAAGACGQAAERPCSQHGLGAACGGRAPRQTLRTRSNTIRACARWPPFVAADGDTAVRPRRGAGGGPGHRLPQGPSAQRTEVALDPPVRRNTPDVPGSG